MPFPFFEAFFLVAALSLPAPNLGRGNPSFTGEAFFSTKMMVAINNVF